MAGSEFAKRQLKKHGWTEGSGLGKQENGRSEPIKVSLKMDKSGVGHDPGKEFTDHWWLRVFNEAAQKIGKKKQDDGELRQNKMAESKKSFYKGFVKDDGELRQNKMAESKKSFYKGFVKSSTLTNGIEEAHTHSDSSSDQDDNTSLPTLNDIHKFCGGATGHKAARFGIKMGGKLARVAEYDKIFEEKLSTSAPKTDCIFNNSLPDTVEQKPSITSSQSPDEDITCGSGGDNRRKKKKHKKNKKAKYSDVDSGSKCLTEEVISDPGEILNDFPSEIVCKKNRIKRKHRKNDHIEDTVTEVSQNDESLQCAKSKKRQKISPVKVEDSVCENGMQKKKSKKKKKSEKHIFNDELLLKDDGNDVKKKKKKKHKE